MRVFFRSAPALMALSVALAGCSQSDPPKAKSSATSPAGASASAALDPADSSDYVLTIDGMV